MLSKHALSLLRVRLAAAQKESEDMGYSSPSLLMPEMLRAPYAGWRVYLAELHNADTLTEIEALQSRLAAAEAELAQMTGERDRYKREVTDYEEREAACCPEDFGFDEVIASLRKRCAAAEAAAEMARQMLDRAASRLLSYGPKDVVGLEIRAHLASRPKAQGPAGGEVPRGQA